MVYTDCVPSRERFHQIRYLSYIVECYAIKSLCRRNDGDLQSGSCVYGPLGSSSVVFFESSP